LIILVVVVVVLGVGAVVGRSVRHRIIAERALEAGRAALAQGDYEEGTRQLRIYLSVFRDDVEVLEEYGQACLKIRPRTVESVKAAVAAYRLLLRDHRPTDREILTLLAGLYNWLGRPEEVAFICRRWIQAYPDDPDAILWQAKLAVSKRQFDQAKADLERAVEHDPKVDLEVYQLLSMITLQSERPSALTDALVWLERAVEAHPDSAAAYVSRAALLREACDRASRQGDSGTAEASRRRAYADLDMADRLSIEDPRVALLACEEWTAWKEFDRADRALRVLESVGAEILEKYDIGPGELALMKYDARARLVLGSAQTDDYGAIADEGLSEIPEFFRGSFQGNATRLYLRADRVDEAREALEAYRVWLSRPGGPGATAEEFLVLEASVNLQDTRLPERNRAYRVIQLLEPVVVREPDDPWAYNLLALAHEVLGDTDEAARLREKYIQRTGGDARSLLALASNYAGTDWQRALQFARMSLARQETFEARLVEAEALLRTLDQASDRQAVIDRCRTELKRLQQQRPKSTPVRLLLAAAWEEEGRLEEAERELQRARSETEEPVRASMALAAFFLRHDMAGKAAQVCEETVRTEPDVAQTWLLLADLRNEAGDTAGAIAVLREAIGKLSGSELGEAQDGLVRYLLLGNERQAALALLRQMKEERPSDVAVRLRLLRMQEVREDEREVGSLMEEIKSIEEADPAADRDGCLNWKVERALWLLDRHRDQNDQLRAYSAEITGLLQPCVESRPRWDRPIFGLGLMYELLGQFSRAEETYKRFYNLTKDPGAVADHLVEVLRRQGKYVEAQEIVDQLPDATAAHRRISIALERGEYEQAIEELQEHIAAAPEDVESRVLLARLTYAQKQDLERALALLDEAQDIEPDDPEIVQERATILAAAGREDEALQLVNAEVQRRQDFGSYLLRARLYNTLGDKDRAETDYRYLATIEQSEPAGHLLLAQFYRRGGRIKEAVAACEEGLRFVPDSEPIQRLLMEVLVTDSDPSHRARGVRLLDELLAAHPEDAELRRLRVQVDLSEGGDSAQAEEALQEIVRDDPGNVAAWRDLIQLARDRNNAAAATEHLGRALAANPTSMELLLLRAQLELVQGRRATAIQLAKSAREMHPSRVEPRLLLANLYLSGGDAPQAADALDEAFQLDPDSEAVRMARSSYFLAVNQPEQAIDNLASYVDEGAGAEAIDAMTMLINIHLNRREFDKAQARLEQAVAIGKNKVKVALLRARLLGLRDRFDQIPSLVDAIDPAADGYTTLLREVALVLTASESPTHWVQARQMLDKMVSIEPNSIDGYLGIAMVEYRRKNRDHCMQAYRKVLELDPNQQQALNDLAWVLAEGGAPEEMAEAETLANKAVDRYPGYPNILDTRGYVFYKLGRYDEARDDLERCLAVVATHTPTYAKALMHLGQVLAKLDRRQEARDRLEEALQADAQHMERTPGASSFFNKDERRQIDELLQVLGEQ
jgi:tetratricopeptide (TPR) repeat protein